MSRWMGKFVIGVTGNIATGKSVVRKLLEHLGAYTIDVDTLTKRALSKGAPVYPKVVKLFGTWVFDNDGQILRDRLLMLFFIDPNLKDQLDSIIEPLITKAIDILVRGAKQSVVVIESKRLVGVDLSAGCDSIWVVTSSKELQSLRLTKNRSLSENEARQRILADPPQGYKLRAADVVINNDGHLENTWEQVKEAWTKLSKPKEPFLSSKIPLKARDLIVRRGMPHDAADIARFITEATRGKRRMTHMDVMNTFGEKTYLLIETDSRLVGAAGWYMENLVSCLDEFYFEQGLALDQAVPALMKAVEILSQELLSEVIILIIPPYLVQYVGAWPGLGYRSVTIQGLGVRAWQEVAINTMHPGYLLWYKRLSEDRILRLF